jgi:hypothetical protein
MTGFAHGGGQCRASRHGRPASGYSTDEMERRRGVDPGITILPKPITPAALTAAIRQRLDQAAGQALGTTG